MSALRPSVALAAYAEAAADGRRVLVVGDALGSLADQLVQRGARYVYVCDPEPLRVAQASAKNRDPNVSFGPLADGHVALQSGAFDLAIVENLGATNVVAVVRRVRRSLAPRGVALFACPNPDARWPLLEVPDPGATSLDYYALYDAVAADFSVVRMLGQAPFVGYAIADFAPGGEPEPAIDSAFVPGGAEEPDWFIALAAQHPIDLEQFYVVQLPARSVLSASGAGASDQALRRARDEEQALRRRVLELERKLQKPAAASPPDHEREIARLNAWIAELEARAATADERADRAEAELEELRTRSEAEISALRSSESALQSSLEALKEQLRVATEATSEDEANEIAALERQLVERAAEIRRLTRELREAERVGRELLRELGRRKAAPDADIERLRAELARREADLTAARWVVDSLRERLGGGRGPERDPVLDPAAAELQQRAVLSAQIQGSR